MHTSVNTEIQAQTSPPSAAPAVLTRTLDSLDAADIGKIRHQIRKDLKTLNIPTDISDHCLLALSEILSNLIAHPKDKSTKVEISLWMDHNDMHMDVADDSTPFADFDAKCKWSLGNLQKLKAEEAGRGLGLVQKNVSTVRYAPKNTAKDGLNHFSLTKTISVKQAAKETVFIVDDDPVCRLMVTSMLENNYTVVTFENGREALDAFQTKHPALIISDLMMPEMDGIELRKALSKTPTGDMTPFIFLSGNTEEKNNPYLNQLGIDDFVTKPVAKKKLLEIIGRLLARSKQVRQKIETRVSSKITSLLRPSLSENMGDWKAYVRTRVADTGGGDMALELMHDDGVTVILADVMGSGLEAKFFAYAYAGYLRSLFRLQPATSAPDVLLRALSRAVIQDSFLDERIITCIAMTMSENGSIIFASAGHPCPILISGDAVQPIAVSGPLPGLIGNSTYPLVKLNLKPGEKVVLYTDGFSEITKQDLIERITPVIREKPKSLINALWNQFEDITAANSYNDDTTLIVLEYIG